MASDNAPLPSRPAEERQLCLNCVSPNDPKANFCLDCGAPLSSYAATGPYERIFAEGHLYRKAVEQPRNLLVVSGLWLLFATMAGGLLLPFFASPELGFWEIALAALIGFPSLLIVWKATARYFLPRGQ